MKCPRINRPRIKAVLTSLGALLLSFVMVLAILPAQQAHARHPGIGWRHPWYVPQRTPSAQRGQVNQLNFNFERHGLPTRISGGNILHAWNMSFNEIRAQLPYIAEAGFGVIQTSPIGESLYTFDYQDAAVRHLARYQGTWWMLYQPTGFTIGNLLGTEDEFRALTREAAEHGIFIIVDAVPNHLTTWWNAIDDPLRQPWITWGYHAPGSNASGMPGSGTWYDNNINDWGHRYNTTRRRLVALLDLATTYPRVQQTYFGFLADKIAAGATGFRYDAAAHIELPCGPNWWNDGAYMCSDFFPNMLNFVEQRVREMHGVEAFQYGELLHRWHYRYLRAVPNMALTADPYGYGVRDRFIQGNLQGWDANFWGSPAVPNNMAHMMVPWIESHDTFGNAGVSRWINDDQLRIGWAIIAARAGTTPLWLVRPANNAFYNNSQMFVPQNDGSFANRWGHSTLYRDASVAAVNWFANSFHGMAERTSTHGQIAMIERGISPQQTSGVVIVNTSPNAWTRVDFPVNMPNGQFTDQVSGNVFTVANGRISGHYIRPRSVAVIHNFVNVADQVAISAHPGTSTFDYEGGIDVTLSAQNTNSATFEVTLDGAVVTPATAFANGQVVRVGAGAQVGDVFELTLRGVGSSDTVTQTFQYTKVDANAAIRIEFTHPSWNNAHIHAWVPGAAGPTNLTGNWPGQPMVREVIDGQNVWVFTFSPDVSGPFNIIFNNGVGGTGNQTDYNIGVNGSYRFDHNGNRTIIVPPRRPAVFAAHLGTNFATLAGVEVTLHAQRTTSQTWSVNGSEPMPFHDGDVVTIGRNARVGEVFNLTIQGTDGTHGHTYNTQFVRVDPTAPVRIEFTHPTWNNVNMHAFNSQSDSLFGDWPGLALSRAVVDGVPVWVGYLPAGTQMPTDLVFNNNSGQQVPAMGVGGFRVYGPSRVTHLGEVTPDIEPHPAPALWVSIDGVRHDESGLVEVAGTGDIVVSMYGENMDVQRWQTRGMPFGSPFANGFTHTITVQDLPVGQTDFYLNLSGDALNGEHVELNLTIVRVVADDPIEDDPIVDDPIEDDPIEDDPIEDDPIEDDPIEDDPIVDDPIVDDPIVDDPADDAPDYDYVYVGDLDVFMPELPYLPQGAERGFYDVASDHHFANYIGWLTYHRIANGWDAEGTQTLPTFRPGLAISRQAMAAFLFRAAGSPAFDEPTEASFVDVPTNHPFFTEIEWLATTGITTGWADGTFRPGNDITRESMAAFLYRFHGRPELGDLSGYGFVDTASSPFANYISWLASTGITTGWADGTFRPGNTVTREAMAAFLHRAYAGAAAQAFDAGLWHIGALAVVVADEVATNAGYDVLVDVPAYYAEYDVVIDVPAYYAEYDVVIDVPAYYAEYGYVA